MLLWESEKEEEEDFGHDGQIQRQFEKNRWLINSAPHVH
jgi:hypothetical protein